MIHRAQENWLTFFIWLFDHFIATIWLVIMKKLFFLIAPSVFSNVYLNSSDGKQFHQYKKKRAINVILY